MNWHQYDGIKRNLEKKLKHNTQLAGTSDIQLEIWVLPVKLLESHIGTELTNGISMNISIKVIHCK